MATVLPRKTASRLRPERRIADIMLAARDLFRARDYDDVPISDIALKAGVVEGTLYRYFDSKRDLLIKVTEAWYEEMLADFDQQLAGIGGTRNRLRFMIWKHLSSIEQEPALCRLVFQVLRPGPDYTATSVYELNREYTRRTLGIIQEGIDAGEFRKDVPARLVRDMIFGSIEHHTWSYLRGQGKFDAQVAADAITDLLTKGLAALPATQQVSGEAAIQRLERVAARLEELAAGDGR